VGISIYVRVRNVDAVSNTSSERISPPPPQQHSEKSDISSRVVGKTDVFRVRGEERMVFYYLHWQLLAHKSQTLIYERARRILDTAGRTRCPDVWLMKY